MLTRVFAALVFACAATNVRAAIIVTFESTSITANQIAFVDVWVESTSNDDLTGFEAYFQLVAPATANGTLSFAPSSEQPSSQTMFGSEYVLSGAPGLDPINYSAKRLSPTEIRLIDFLNGDEKELETRRWRLAQFKVIHFTANAALADGDTYEIKMFQSSSQDSTDTTTFFNFSNPDLHIPERPASPGEPFPNSGSIRVTAGSTTAVPEPSSAVAISILAAIGGYREYRKRRQISGS